MTEPSLRGSLASFQLPDVLTFVSSAKKSGTLTLTNGSNEAIVYFDDGAVIFAGSNQETLRLSAVLLRRRVFGFPLALAITAAVAGFAVATQRAATIAHPVLLSPTTLKMSGWVEMREERERSDRGKQCACELDEKEV